MQTKIEPKNHDAFRFDLINRLILITYECSASLATDRLLSITSSAYFAYSKVPLASG